jgi:glycosyltransferase involved in cell wall biosynthesis
MKGVSVVIPTHNRAACIRQAIDTALAQTSPPLEVIVVDDGSTDETPRILAEYGGRIRVIRQPNAGVSVARNAGIAAAAGDLIALLDSDDSWWPTKLERQVARLAADPGVGLVHCGSEQVDNEGRRLSVSLDGMEGWVAERLLRLDPEVIAAPGSCVLVPKRVVEEIGGFDARLPPSEDWDFCYRIATRYPVSYVREVLVRYRIHEAGAHMNIGRMQSGMLLGLEKAFASGDASVQRLRNHTYGRLHRILAGCYFETGQPRACLTHVIKSLRYDVRNAMYFAAYPLRVASRLSARRRGTSACR